jgi:plastocyanin
MRRAIPAAAAAAALVLLSGCNDDKKKDSGGQQKKGTVSVGRNQPIAFGADEYSFEPSNVVVKAGTSRPTVVRFVLRNNGSLAHDLHVERGGQDLGGTPVFAPGDSKSGQATLTPGTYTFICTVGDHAALGMKGTLTVTTEKVTRPADPDAGQGGEGDRGREKEREKERGGG